VPPEPGQPGFIRVQLQPELRESLPKLSQEPRGVIPVLEPDDEVISEPHDSVSDRTVTPRASSETERICVPSRTAPPADSISRTLDLPD